jgi:hypothetical protein
LGTALVALGVTVNLLAALEYRIFLKRYARGEADHVPRFSLSLISAVMLAALGLVMIGYLLTL